jgi:DNA-binding response OmpR family regulator
VKLLVVEDEKDLADAIARGLTRQTYSVDISYNGTKALELAEINAYDLIILDLNLPEIDGLEVCRRIRANDPKIGILMLTARAGQADRVLGLDIGADDYLICHYLRLIKLPKSLNRQLIRMPTSSLVSCATAAWIKILR